MVKNITLVRGDSLDLRVGIVRKDTLEAYVMEEGDAVCMDIRRTAFDAAPAVSRTYTAADFEDGKVRISLRPSDTADLEPGDYCFDIRLAGNSGEVCTVVPMARLKIVRAVTDIPADGGTGGNG